MTLVSYPKRNPPIVEIETRIARNDLLYVTILPVESSIYTDMGEYFT